MKVIFLDIDGVINTDAYHIHLKKQGKPTFDYFDGEKYDIFDPNCVNRLNTIISQTGAKIVLSSSWRQMFLNKIPELQKVMNEQGIVGEFVGTTPYIKITDVPVDEDGNPNGPEGPFTEVDVSRGDEIQYFMDHTNLEIENYVIIDDWVQVEFKRHQWPHFVNTDMMSGIQNKDVEKAISILMKQF